MVCATSKGSDQPAHMRSLIRAVACGLNILLTKHYLEFLSLKGGCTGSSESTLVKMPHCWKSHDTTQLYVHDFQLFTTIKNKNFIMLGFNLHRSFLTRSVKVIKTVFIAFIQHVCVWGGHLKVISIYTAT